jgi:hypothetical protein
MNDFKFAIGDRVTLTECAREVARLNAGLKADAWATYQAPLLVVRGRLLEECYGGAQRHYDCRAIMRPSKTVGDMTISFSAKDLGAGLFRVSEPELQHFDEAQATTEPSTGAERR